MLFSQQDKNRLKNHLFKILSSIKGVISITLVGSFWTKKNLNDFSDVDIVIILEEFNQHKYNYMTWQTYLFDSKQCQKKYFYKTLMPFYTKFEETVREHNAFLL